MTADHEATMRAAVDQLVAAIRATVQAELAAQAPPEPPRERLLTVDQAAAELGIGRSRLYEEIGAGRLRSVKVGRRRLVPASAITGYIKGLARGEGRDPR